MREIFFAGTFFWQIVKKKTQKSQKLEPPKNLVPHGIFLQFFLRRNYPVQDLNAVGSTASFSINSL